MPKERTSNGHNSASDAQEMLREVARVLESHGVPEERLPEIVARLSADSTESSRGDIMKPDVNENGNGAHPAAPRAEAALELSDNARVILEKRYLRKDDQGNFIETPEGLFQRVSSAIAAGEAPEAQELWRGRFYDMLASLKFLPNSPTLVNAGTGRGCLSACFVVSPEDNMDSIMDVAHDAAMIEKWGGGIGFGFSRLRPRLDRIATTHGEACGPISVMRLYSSVGATLTQGAFRLGAHMGQLIVSHPDIREFIHCKDNDDTLQNFNISVQVTDDFMRAVEADAEWPLINPRDAGSGPVNEVVTTIRARELWNEICESAWKTGDPGIVFIDRVWETQPNPQMGYIQTSNPCGEEFLENYGNCCLGSINLDRHIRGGDFDWAALEETVRTAVRFLDDVIEVNEFPLPRLREVNLATRRIGLGIMGWADALVRLGVPYDSQEALERADKLGKFIHDTAWDESAKLAEERGPFPEYERSALKERGMPPVRNSSVVTIAPTGTISRIAGCSSGIEPHFAIAWWSNVLWKDQEAADTRLLDAPASVWETLQERLGDPDKVREALQRVADSESAQEAEQVLSEYGLDAARFRTSMAISAEAHVRMQGTWQQWVTNSVSKTINLPNKASVQDVYDSFWLAWQTGCKAVTVYRDGSKSMQVLETGKETREEKQSDSRLLTPRQRPASVRGVTDRVRTGHGNIYVTLNFDDEGRPFELFTALGKAGGCDSAHLEGLSRMISLALRSGIAPKQIVDELRSITCCPVWDNGVLVRSAEDAVALVLSRYMDGVGPSPTPGGHSEQLGLFPSDQASTEGVNGHQATSARCPECSGYVIHQEGCLKCLDCGYTKCE